MMLSVVHSMLAISMAVGMTFANTEMGGRLWRAAKLRKDFNP